MPKLNRFSYLLSGLFLIWLAGCTSTAYRQSFDTPESLRDFTFTDPDKWRYVDNGLAGGALEFAGRGNYTPPVRSPYSIGLIADKTFGDFVLDVDLLQTGREYGHRDMCLFFGFQDPSHFYYVHLATKADPHAHNIFIVNGAPRTRIATQTTDGIDWGQDQWHHVRLIRNTADGAIEVYFDDLTAPIMTATDTTFDTGYIGFGSFDDSGRIDNITIVSPDMQIAPSDFFEIKQPGPQPPEVS